MDSTAFKSRIPEDLINWHAEHPEVCSPHIQGWSFVGTYSPIAKVFELECFVIIVASICQCWQDAKSLRGLFMSPLVPVPRNYQYV